VSGRAQYMSTSIAFRVLTVTHLQLDAHVSVRYKSNSSGYWASSSSQSYVEIESKKKEIGDRNGRVPMTVGALFVCLFVALDTYCK